MLAESIRRFGWTNPLLLAPRGWSVVAGHGRLEAARLLGLEAVPAVRLSGLSPAQVRAYVLADNRLAELASWDRELLALEVGALRDAGVDLFAVGFDEAAVAALLAPSGPGPEAVGFGVPPLSVWNAREGPWRARRAEWLALGLRSELGRPASGRASA